MAPMIIAINALALPGSIYPGIDDIEIFHIQQFCSLFIIFNTNFNFVRTVLPLQNNMVFYSIPNTFYLPTFHIRFQNKN